MAHRRTLDRASLRAWHPAAWPTLSATSSCRLGSYRQPHRLAKITVHNFDYATDRKNLERCTRGTLRRRRRLAGSAALGATYALVRRTGNLRRRRTAGIAGKPVVH